MEWDSHRLQVQPNQNRWIGVSRAGKEKGREVYFRKGDRVCGGNRRAQYIQGIEFYDARAVREKSSPKCHRFSCDLAGAFPDSPQRWPRPSGSQVTGRVSPEGSFGSIRRNIWKVEAVA